MAETSEITPTEVVVQDFRRYALHAVDDFSGQNPWGVATKQLFGDPLFGVLSQGKVVMEGLPEVNQILREAYENSGLSGLKAKFLALLVHDTDFSTTGGATDIPLQRIIDYQPGMPLPTPYDTPE